MKRVIKYSFHYLPNVRICENKEKNHFFFFNRMLLSGTNGVVEIFHPVLNVGQKCSLRWRNEMKLILNVIYVVAIKMIIEMLFIDLFQRTSNLNKSFLSRFRTWKMLKFPSVNSPFNEIEQPKWKMDTVVLCQLSITFKISSLSCKPQTCQ